MISLNKIRQLEYNRPQNENRPAFVSSASGLIFFQNFFYFIGDDENKLFLFQKNEPIQSLSLNSVNLPSENTSRKKMKPDFESLMILNNSILIVPSGSTEKRQTGYSVCKNHEIKKIDFSILFKELRQNLNEINIEASLLINNEIYLFNRGNSNQSDNALIAIKNEFPFTDKSILKIFKIQLPKMNHVQLAVTDVALTNENKICFIAAAEDTNNSYDDGQFNGAAIGYMNLSGEVEKMFELDISEKPEGLSLDIENRLFYLVTDADDPNKASSFYEGILP